MNGAPSAGLLTFLLTDIEGSTAAWERAGDPLKTALASHHTLLRREFQGHRGREVKEIGDSFLVAFAAADDALACAVLGQRVLASHSWPPEVGSLCVRMALHSGDVELEQGGYRGLVLHHASRLLGAAHGGQILCSEVTAGLLREGGPRALPPGVQLTDLGIHRLRDLTAPAHLFQVEYPGMVRREFPPLNTERGCASNLPLQFDRFFGRAAELASLHDLLLTQHTRLVTLTGSGGSGKTRLALELAWQLRETLQGAVWFVPLADLSDPNLIPDAVRSALRLPRSSSVAPLEQVVGALARQPSLLVLDNFEHLVEEGASTIRSLLARATMLQCLVTSRRRLDLEGEHELPIDPLPVPSGAATPERLGLYESVQLFIDRAQTVRPEFRVTSANASAVAALCERLEGLPLALELAAARAGVLSPQQMLARLKQRFVLLVRPGRPADPRHRSLRAAIDWSYQLLSPAEQRFFARLSIFRGGWTLQAAEAVCEEPNALDYLQRLKDSSLVLTEVAAEEIRFRILETLREFGAEQLVPEERASLERKHVAFYLALAEEAELHLSRAVHASSLDQLEREHDNLRAALRCALEQGEAEVGLRLGAALRRFWEVRGRLAEGRERLAALLALAGAAKQTSVRARALMAMGEMAWAQADYEASRASFEEALAIWRTLDNNSGTAGALANLALVAREQGDYVGAGRLHEESLEIWRALGDPWNIALWLSNLGTLAYIRADYETARSLQEEGLAMQRKLGDQWAIALLLSNLGSTALCQGDYASVTGRIPHSTAPSPGEPRARARAGRQGGKRRGVPGGAGGSAGCCQRHGTCARPKLSGQGEGLRR